MKLFNVYGSVTDFCKLTVIYSSILDPGYTSDMKYTYPIKVIFTSAMLFTFLVSVMGNSLVIYVITKHRSMRTSTNCLIMNLAICDLLITAFQTPLFIKNLHTGYSWFEGTLGTIICKVTAFGISLLVYCSVLNMVAIALDRFLAVARPLKYRLASEWLVKIGIPVVWLSSCLLSINSVLVAKLQNYSEDRAPDCIKSEHSSPEEYISVSCIAGSFVVLIVLYSIICHRLCRRNIPGEVSNNQQALAIRTARKVTLLMISVVIVFFVSWAPALVVVVANLFDTESAINILIFKKYPILVIVSYWLILNSSASNPCLYFIFIERLRQSLNTACLRCRAPNLCRIGQVRQFETGESVRNRHRLHDFSLENGAIELAAYTTANHRVAPC